MPPRPANAFPIGRIASLAMRAQTYQRLGFANLLRVAAYRFLLKTPLSPIRTLSAPTPRGPFFRQAAVSSVDAPMISGWSGALRLFGHIEADNDGSAPDFKANPINGRKVPDADRPWFVIPDFNPAVGDIKAVWELSRFEWVLAFAQQARNGHGDARARLEYWLAEWNGQNPPYHGPNWKCGQEASIRVMHLAMATLILGGPGAAGEGLLDMVAAHLKRIAPTTAYAIGQDNNHGTSEAAALFVGGSWLAANGRPEGNAHAAKGRRMLEERVRRLVMADGGFSQYSVNYHRVLLDTLAIAETWRRRIDAPPFSADLAEKAKSAAVWLWRLTDEHTGEAPNIGANDGARLIPLFSDYGDFRQSVQTVSILFDAGNPWPGNNGWSVFARWLGLGENCDTVRFSASQSDEGKTSGFAVIRRARWHATLRVPRYRFRPSQSDALHLDLRDDSHPLLVDAGTYSYNCEPELQDYFGSARAHNTVSFDERDQMPRLSRFLFGKWIGPRDTTFHPDDGRMSAGYTDGFGCSHDRTVELGSSVVVVTDRIEGPFNIATIRWRLSGPNWRLDGGVATDGTYRITVSSLSGPAPDLALEQAPASRKYLSHEPVTVLEARVTGPATVITRIASTP